MLKKGSYITFLTKFLIIFIVFFTVLFSAEVLHVDSKVAHYDLLPHSQIYIDINKTKNFDEIADLSTPFEDNHEILRGFGYSPNFNVWLRFSITNTSDKIIEQILEYDHALTSNIVFYAPQNNYMPLQDGLFHITNERKTINPIFTITLKPNETQTCYIKASSHITTLIVKLNLWKSESFYEKEISRQVILALFFGSMFILALYNTFIYFFTKDLSYLYYSLYIFGILIHHFFYVGLSNIYIINPSWNEAIIQYASLIVGFPAFALAVFTKSFLKTKQYPLWNKILNIYLIIFPILLSIFLVTDSLNKYRNIFAVLLLIYLLSMTIYASFKRNRQAYFILFGWLVFISAGLFMYLSSTGIFSIYKYFPYYVEVSLVVEAIVFSIALADRIKQLQIDKEEANLRLIAQQKNEKDYLKQEVKKKTLALQISLDEKKLLLKELNHRVKKNMQTIVSLIRLQSDKVDDKLLQDFLITIQNRINAMSHLHELLYTQEDITHIDAYEYFEILIEEVRESYSHNEVEINFDITANLKMEQAVYCGLILNELITNAFKYAFPAQVGTITIKLYKKNNLYSLDICDDGIGYNQEIQKNSLGLLLVTTLVKEQLEGTLKIDTSDGVKIKIRWSVHE